MKCWTGSQAGTKIARRNVNNLRYVDDTTLKADSKEELKSFLTRVNEESEKVGLKLNIQKTKIVASSPVTSWQINGEKMETVMDFIFLGSKITADDDCSHKIKTLAPWKTSYDKYFFSHSVMSDSLWTHGLQYARLSFPSLSPSLLKLMSIESVMPSNHLILCHPLLFLPSFFPSIRVFSIESALASDGQNIGALFSASDLPMNIQGWFPLILTGLISLQSKGLSRVFSSTTIRKHQFFTAQPSFCSNSHIHTWLLEKQEAFTLTYGISNLSSQIFCYF